MKNSNADLILHPIRMRIIQTLIGGARRTRQQISEILIDVPQATMYRHLNLLHQANLIEVVEQNPIRGTMEKVYALREHGAEVPIQDLNAMNADEHMELLMKFVANLIGEYGRYLGQERYDLVKDGVSFRQVALNLNDSELLQLLQGIRDLMLQHLGNEPGSGRRRRTFATIVIPEAERSSPTNGIEETNES